MSIRFAPYLSRGGPTPLGALSLAFDEKPAPASEEEFEPRKQAEPDPPSDGFGLNYAFDALFHGARGQGGKLDQSPEPMPAPRALTSQGSPFKIGGR